LIHQLFLLCPFVEVRDAWDEIHPYQAGVSEAGSDGGEVYEVGDTPEFPVVLVDEVSIGASALDSELADTLLLVPDSSQAYSLLPG
jgi:hypothetical protein